MHLGFLQARISKLEKYLATHNCDGGQRKKYDVVEIRLSVYHINGRKHCIDKAMAYPSPAAL